jgi:hypothetical protein
VNTLLHLGCGGGHQDYTLKEHRPDRHHL